MSFRDTFKQALTAENLPVVALCVDHLRAKGFTYQALYEYANNLTGIELPEWETLMGELE